MRIAINVAWMAPGKAGGMEWYVRALIDELASIDDRNDYVLVTSHLNDNTFELPGPRWEKLPYFGDDVSPAAYRRLIPPHPSHSPPYLGQMLRGAQVDLLFCPLMYALPLGTGLPVVVTIPDLQHKALPTLFDDFELGSRNLGFPDTIRRATAVLGISEHVASEIQAAYDIEADRVVATPLGLSPDFVTDTEVLASYSASARAQYRVEGDYLFFPGNAWPHKNHARLLEAFERVLVEAPEVRLVLTGENAVGALIPPRLRGSVDHLGYVSREELIGLMAGAAALVFPSRFEGFGLPLLEAMAVGTPILCSDLPTLHEVGGDVPEYFDGDSTDSIANTIIGFLRTPDAAARQQALMAQQVAKFSYRSTAEKTLAVFDDIASGRRTAPQELATPNVVLGGNSELTEGYARWTLDAPRLASIDLEVFAVAYTPDGRPRLPSIVALSVNGVVVSEVRVESGGSSRHVVAKVPDWLELDQLQQIELHDISDPRARESSEVRIARLVAFDESDGEMRVI